MALTAFETAADLETDEDPLELMDEIEALKKEKDATILAHYYVDGEIQDIADFAGDSLKLARDAVTVTSSTIVFAGVHFMRSRPRSSIPKKPSCCRTCLRGVRSRRVAQPTNSTSFSRSCEPKGATS